MKTVQQHIDYLLIYNNRVPIPGIGSVIAYGTSARFEESTETWYPPLRAFTFDPAPTADDSMLTHSVARREGISETDARRLVANGISTMQAELDRNGYVGLGSSGLLKRSESGTYTFTPGDAQWLSPALLWLPPAKACLVKSASVAAQTNDRESPKMRMWPTLLRRIGGAAACVTVIFALAWILTSNLRTAPAEQFASVGPAPERAESVIPQPGKAEAPLILVLNRHADAVVDVDRDEKKISNAPGYYLIVASLASVEEAQKFISHYPDSSLGILEMDGRYRVYAARSDSEAGAYACASDPAISSRFSASWVCRF